MIPTDQQLAIENADLFGTTKVVAYAGTGKTTMLEGLSRAQAKKGLSGLYLAFTKASQIDAAARFSLDWVTVKTINGLAHGVVFPRYRKKFRKYSIKSIEVIKFMGLSWNWSFARLVLDTLNFWCVSDLYEFPKMAVSISGSPIGTIDYLQYAAVVARQLWERMIDVNDEVPISHDGMLKVYQLSQPRLSFPYIMLDEFQDTNPVTWDILKRQSSPLVVVGDPYQSIFQFRGAVNVMDGVEASQTFPLTQSFRFGRQTADIANALLCGFFWEDVPLVGLGPKTVVGRINTDQPHAVISRTNAAIFNQAVKAMEERKRLSFIGGVESYNFGRIIDMWHLQAGQRSEIKDEFIKDFDCFEDLAEYAENANDLEFKRMIETVGNYGNQVQQIVPALHASCVKDHSHAQITFSTAHKCKGSTLGVVKLADDFPELVDARGQLMSKDLLDKQEVHLYYVALTRAMYGMQLNATTVTFLKTMGMDVEQFTADVPSGFMAHAKLQQPAKQTAASIIERPSRTVPAAWLPATGQTPEQMFTGAPAHGNPATISARPAKSDQRGQPAVVESRLGIDQLDLFS